MRSAFVAFLLLCASAVLWAAPASQPSFLKVKSFKPRHGRTFVPLEARVFIKFSRPVDLATATPQTVQLTKLSGEQVAVTYEAQRGGRVLAVTPVDGLQSATDYRIVVRPGLKSADGATLRTDRHSNFFTEIRVSPLAILRPDQFRAVDTLMSEGRAAHSASVLPDGRVLLAGGLVDYTVFAVSGDVWDPSTGAFRSSGGRINQARAYHPAARFGSGMMLVGGTGPNGALSSTEVYFPSSFEFFVGPPLAEQRDFVAAVTLKDGRVLVTGGLRYVPQGAIYSDTAEIYDAENGGFRFTKGAPVRRRAGHSLTLLPDGRVLVVGGQSGGTSSPVTAEIFDPVTETFTPTASPPANHRQLHVATLVDAAGRVLLVDGGSAILEMYDPASDSFFPAGGASSVNRTGATASLLPDGRVLIAGGLQDAGGGNGVALDGFDIWVNSGGDHGSVLRPSVVFPEPRYGHTATTVHDGRVLFAGGFGQTTPDSYDTGIVFTPDPPK